MKSGSRHMKKYTPRRRRSNKDLQKQQLKDFEHLLNMDLSTYILLYQEGNKRQIERAREKLSSDLRKYGAELEAIGRDLGEGFPELITNYLKTVHEITRRGNGSIDSAILAEFQKRAVQLKTKAA